MPDAAFLRFFCIYFDKLKLQNTRSRHLSLETFKRSLNKIVILATTVSSHFYCTCPQKFLFPQDTSLNQRKDWDAEMHFKSVHVSLHAPAPAAGAGRVLGKHSNACSVALFTRPLPQKGLSFCQPPGHSLTSGMKAISFWLCWWALVILSLKAKVRA